MTTSRSKWDRLRQDTASDDWDNDGARAISASEWNNAEFLLMRLMVIIGKQLWQEPFVSPGDAAVHFSWNCAGDHFDLEMFDGKYFICSIVGGVSEAEEDVCFKMVADELRAFLSRSLFL